MTKGTSITITDTADGHTFTGTIKFASNSFLTVDLSGGKVVLVRRDEGLNSWMIGRHPVRIEQKATFAARMQRVYDSAMNLDRDVDDDEYSKSYE